MTYRELRADEAERILEIDATHYIESAWRRHSDAEEYALVRINWTDYALPNGNDWHIRRFRETLSGGGKVFGCFSDDGVLVGYAALNAALFGVVERYVLLDQLFVSAPLRGHGIGRTLLEMCKSAAKAFGARKLYLCAGSAERTIHFYVRMGAVPAAEVNRALYMEDPNDIQLEIAL